jgi:hypothetical protein
MLGQGRPLGAEVCGAWGRGAIGAAGSLAGAAPGRRCLNTSLPAMSSSFRVLIIAPPKREGGRRCSLFPRSQRDSSDRRVRRLRNKHSSSHVRRPAIQQHSSGRCVRPLPSPAAGPFPPGPRPEAARCDTFSSCRCVRTRPAARTRARSLCPPPRPLAGPWSAASRARSHQCSEMRPMQKNKCRDGGCSCPHCPRSPSAKARVRRRRPCAGLTACHPLPPPSARPRRRAAARARRRARVRRWRGRGRAPGQPPRPLLPPVRPCSCPVPLPAPADRPRAPACNQPCSAPRRRRPTESGQQPRRRPCGRARAFIFPTPRRTPHPRARAPSSPPSLPCSRPPPSSGPRGGGGGDKPEFKDFLPLPKPAHLVYIKPTVAVVTDVASRNSVGLKMTIGENKLERYVVEFFSRKL